MSLCLLVMLQARCSNLHTRGNIPARGESEEISNRRGEIAGFRREHTEDGWINMVYRNRANIDKLGQVIFIGDLECVSLTKLSPEEQQLT